MHDDKLKNLPECQRLCIEDNDCVGVLFSTFFANRTGESNCYFCKDDILEYQDNDYDFHLRPGIFIKHFLKISSIMSSLNIYMISL